MLFAGMLDVSSIPALTELRSLGLFRPARFVPPRASDPGRVLSHLTISTFTVDVDLSVAATAVPDVLDACPRVDIGDRIIAGRR